MEGPVAQLMGRSRTPSITPACRVLALVAVVTLAACGARLSDEQLHAAGARPGAGSVTNEAGLPTGSTQPASSSAISVGTAVGTAGGAATDGSSLSSTGGPAGASDSSGGCQPASSGEVGVSDTSISLGEVTTLTGPIPGLGQTGVNGVRAYLAYRNALGGVCGRMLELSVADDRFDTGENRAATQRLMGQTFALVGGWSAVDDGGAGALEASNVPDVGLAISDARFGLANNFSSNPITAGQSGALPILRYFQQTYQPASAAVVWAASPVPRARAAGYVRDLEGLGLAVPVQAEVAVTETNYVAVAQQIENTGADLVITALESTGIARLAQAFDQIDYTPTVPFYGAQAYGDAFLELAGDSAEGAILGITHPIVEDAAGNPQLQTFLEWYQRVNPGSRIDFFSFQGWVAAAMLADALVAAGPAPTRDAVLGALRALPSYDAGGLVAPFDPAGKQNSTCYLIVTVTNGRWERLHPASGFACE